MNTQNFQDNGLLRWDEPIEKNVALQNKNLNLPLNKNSAKKLPPMEGKAQVDDVLKYIFPPREFNINGKEYQIQISPEEPLKEDITY